MTTATPHTPEPTTIDPWTDPNYAQTAASWNVNPGMAPGFMAYVCATTRDELGAAVRRASNAQRELAAALADLASLHERLHGMVTPPAE